MIAAAGGVVLARRQPGRAARRRRDGGVAVGRPDVLVEPGHERTHRPLLDDDPHGDAARDGRPSASRCTARSPTHVIDDRPRGAGDIADEIARQVAGRRWLTSAASPCRSATAAIRRPRRRRRALGSWPALLPPTARRVAVVTQAGIPLGDRSIAGLCRRLDVTRVEIGAGEAAKSLTTIEHADAALRRGRDHPPRRRRRPSAAGWSPTSPGSPPPCGTAACRSSTSPPRCSAWSTPRSAARRASTCPRARTSSARSGSRPA